MNKRRLLKLADLLEADAADKKGLKFDLGRWGSAEDGPVSLSCGTSGCAMGLAVLSGAFRRAGLANYYRGDDADLICPDFKGKTGFEAAEGLFEISERASAFLFDADYYPPRKRTGEIGECCVAKRIRDFVAGKVAP